MQYREIVAVTGMGGLFQLMASKADGVIVRSLADNATKFVPARLHNVTPLESIEIYTTGANVRLHEVLQQINDSKKELPSSKKTSDADIRSWFDGVYPNLDHDRVYTSDLKKMLKWFEILKGANLLDFTAQQEKAPEEEAAAPDVEASEKATETPAKKSSKKALAKEGADNLKPEEAKAQVAEKKKGDQTDLEGAVEGVEAAPAKKAAAKKAAATKDAEVGEEKPAKKTAAKKTATAKKTSKKKDEEEG